MAYSKTFKEFRNSQYISEKLNEKSLDGWVNAQLIDDAGGLDAGSKVMVKSDIWENTAPNNDVEIYTKESGYINVPKNFIELTENLNEGRISMPIGGFTKSDIEKILKKDKDIAFFAKNKHFYITPYMHNKGKLEDADDNSFFAIDKDGDELEINFKDIEFIES
jgi:hypothetical protein